MNNETAEAGPELRRRVDDLSTRLLLDGTVNGVEDELAWISARAAEAGFGEASQTAAGLREQLGREGADPAATLADGLARLQQALPGGSAAPAAPPLSSDPELVNDFIVESREHLTSIEQRSLRLERESADPEVLHSIFRGFHTIKGLAGFLEFEPIQEVAHEVETALNLAREGKLAIERNVIDVVLESVDYLGREIDEVAAHASCERLPGHDALLDHIHSLTEKPSPAAPPPFAAAEAAAPVETVASPDGPPPARGAVPDSFSVRVDTAKLDYLVDMVGEMVIAQSMVRHHRPLAAASDAALQRDLSNLARITGEVQRTAMALRMVPIGQLFQRTSRQVRDLSRKTGKSAELVTRGEDTDLDKTIAEELADPLMHMVRNAIDHGIEEPAARAAAGKPAEARITLAAYHQGGRVVIEVSDDGRGLDAEKIVAKAREKGLIAENAHPTGAEAWRLIFEPGFSTAERVTGISGRGVGMDVVRRQVEKLRGRVEIQSKAGEGTTFLIQLPLTLAIIDGLVVTVGADRYIVPLFSVREMFRPGPDTMFTVRNRWEMVLVRGRLLPVVRLYERFGLDPVSTDPSQALFIVTEGEGRPFCLMVDGLAGKQEVVIKSLGEDLVKMPGLAGAAILGDGRVGLILDVNGLWSAHAG